MNKGQISIDLLVTLIVVILVISGFGIVLTNFQEHQEEFFTKNQLETNALKLANFITSTQTIGDMNFTSKMPIQKISYKDNSLKPQITIDKNFIVLSISQNNKKIEARNYFSKPKNSTIIIDELQLVITNE